MVRVFSRPIPTVFIPTPPDPRGRGRRPHRPPMHATLPPWTYKMGRGTEDETTKRTHVLTPPILALASITPSTPWDLGASLPLLPQLVPPTTSTLVQVIQCTLLCWTYGLIGRNQDKPGVIVFLLASTIWRPGHAAYSLVGARPRGPDTDTYILKKLMYVPC